MGFGILTTNITRTLMIKDFELQIATPGWSISNHHHTMFELTYCLEGSVTQRVQDREFQFSGGDWIFIKSGLRHNTVNSSSRPFVYMAIHFDIDDTDIRKILNSGNTCHFDKNRVGQTDIRQFMSQIDAILHASVIANKRTPSSESRISISPERRLAFEANIMLVINEFILLMHQQLQSNVKEVPHHQLSALEISLSHQIAEELENNAHKEVKISQLAKKFGFSRSHCTELFTKVYSISPRQYLSQIRMSKAKTLLIESDLTVESIAEQLGFSSVSIFSRQFRRWTGKTPSTFRPKHNSVTEDATK